jgi:hypothetical protein
VVLVAFGASRPSEQLLHEVARMLEERPVSVSAQHEQTQ